MQQIKVDFSQVPTRDPVSEGIHTAVVISAEVRASTSGPDPFIAWSYEVTEGPDAGKRVFDNTSFAVAALWRLQAVLEALIGEEETAKVESFTVEAGSVVHPRVVGRPCQIEVTHQQYQDQTRARVNSVLPVKSRSNASSSNSSGKVLK